MQCALFGGGGDDDDAVIWILPLFSGVVSECTHQ